FLGVTEQGLCAIVSTRGNPDCHVILRGGQSGPNYDAANVRKAASALSDAGLPPRLMIDCSHGNSSKDHRRQAVVGHDIAGQVAGAIRAGAARTRVAAARRHTATTAAALTATAAFAPATAFTAIAAATAPTPATAARAPPPAAIAAAGGLQMSALAIARIRRLAFSRGLDRLLHRIRSRLHRLRGFRDFGAGCDRARLRLATDRLLALGGLCRYRGIAHQRDHARAVDVQLLDAAQPRDQARRAGRPAGTARLERGRP